MLTSHKPLCHALGGQALGSLVCLSAAASLNSHRIFDTFLVRRMLPPLPFRAPLSSPASHLLTCLFLTPRRSPPCGQSVMQQRLWQQIIISLSSGVTLTGMDRPLLPKLHHHAFDALHALSHPGVNGSCCLLASQFL